MFDHISFGVRDIARSRAFYDPTLQAIGLKRLSASEDSLGYGKEAVGFWIGVTDSPIPDDPKSGLHVCFAAPGSRKRRAIPRRRSRGGRARQRRAWRPRGLRPPIISLPM